MKNLEVFIPAISTILTGLVGWGLSILRWQVKNEEMKEGLKELDEIIRITVNKVSQTMVEELKKQKGVLTEEDKNRLKMAAIEGIKRTASKALLQTVGMSIKNVDSYISSKIESNVWEGKEGKGR